jgi:hypothetical protein
MTEAYPSNEQKNHVPYPVNAIVRAKTTPYVQGETNKRVSKQMAR